MYETRGWVMEIPILLLLFFVICRGRHFEKGLAGFKFGAIFIVTIIISRKDSNKNGKMWVMVAINDL